MLQPLEQQKTFLLCFLLTIYLSCLHFSFNHSCDIAYLSSVLWSKWSSFSFLLLLFPLIIMPLLISMFLICTSICVPYLYAYTYVIHKETMHVSHAVRTTLPGGIKSITFPLKVSEKITNMIILVLTASLVISLVANNWFISIQINSNTQLLFNPLAFSVSFLGCCVLMHFAEGAHNSKLLFNPMGYTASLSVNQILE